MLNLSNFFVNVLDFLLHLFIINILAAYEENYPISNFLQIKILIMIYINTIFYKNANFIVHTFINCILCITLYIFSVGDDCCLPSLQI